MTWNKKNDHFASSCRVRPSTEKGWRWILRRVKPNEPTEIEIDLRTFNQEIARHRPQGGYDRKTLKEIIAQLDEKTQGHILITKSYSWAVHKILVRPLNWVLQNSPPGVESPKLTRGEPMYSEDHKNRLARQQQQEKDIEIIRNHFDRIGMKWDDEALLKIWRLSGKNVDDVKDAVDFMLHCNSTQKKPIKKPHAWFIWCMEGRKHDGFIHQLLYSLPRFKSKVELMTYVTCHVHGDYDIRGSDPLLSPI